MNTLLSVISKPKDKIQMVLEPLQSMIQLAILSMCPVGTKLTIHDNILSLQTPNMIQPFSRWYYADKKDDLYFLYSVIKRFIKWYNPEINGESPLSAELYSLIVTMSMKGLEQLFHTYSTSDSNTVIHVIQMYKNILEFNNDKILMDEYFVDAEKGRVNLDEVFIHIIQIYEDKLLNVLHPLLILLMNEGDQQHQEQLIHGLNLILDKTHHTIKQWIKMKLVL
jgi:hypothetical protein